MAKTKKTAVALDLKVKKAKTSSATVAEKIKKTAVVGKSSNIDKAQPSGNSQQLKQPKEGRSKKSSSVSATPAPTQPMLPCGLKKPTNSSQLSSHQRDCSVCTAFTTPTRQIHQRKTSARKMSSTDHKRTEHHQRVPSWTPLDAEDDIYDAPDDIDPYTDKAEQEDDGIDPMDAASKVLKWNTPGRHLFRGRAPIESMMCPGMSMMHTPARTSRPSLLGLVAGQGPLPTCVSSASKKPKSSAATKAKQGKPGGIAGKKTVVGKSQNSTVIVNKKPAANYASPIGHQRPSVLVQQAFSLSSSAVSVSPAKGKSTKSTTKNLSSGHRLQHSMTTAAGVVSSPPPTQQHFPPLVEIDLMQINSREQQLHSEFFVISSSKTRTSTVTASMLFHSPLFRELVDCLAGLCGTIGLYQTTFHLATVVLQIYLVARQRNLVNSNQTNSNADSAVTKKDKKTMVVVAAMIASKMEEEEPLSAKYAAQETHLSAKTICLLEREMILSTGFKLNVPTSFAIMDLLFLAGNIDSVQQQWSSLLCDVAAAMAPTGTCPHALSVANSKTAKGTTEVTSGGCVLTAFACIQLAALALGRKTWCWSSVLKRQCSSSSSNEQQNKVFIGFAGSIVRGEVPTDSAILGKARSLAAIVPTSLKTLPALWERYANPANGALTKKVQNIRWGAL